MSHLTLKKRATLWRKLTFCCKIFVFFFKLKKKIQKRLKKKKNNAEKKENKYEF